MVVLHVVSKVPPCAQNRVALGTGESNVRLHVFLFHVALQLVLGFVKLPAGRTSELLVFEIFNNQRLTVRDLDDRGARLIYDL